LGAGQQLDAMLTSSLRAEAQFPGHGARVRPLPQFIYGQNLLSRPALRAIECPSAEPRKRGGIVIREHPGRIEDHPPAGQGLFDFPGCVGWLDTQPLAEPAQIIKQEAARWTHIQQVAKRKGRLARAGHAHDQRVGRLQGEIRHGRSERCRLRFPG